MESRFVLAEDELLEAGALSSKTKWILVAFMVAVLALVFLPGAEWVAAGVSIAAAVLLGPIVLSGSRRKVLRRQYARSPFLGNEQMLRLDDEGVHYENSIGRGTVFWGGVIGVFEHEHVWIFKLPGNLMLVMPKRAVEDHDALVQILGSHGLHAHD